MNSEHTLSRRQFLVSVAAGTGALVLGFHLPGRLLAAGGTAKSLNAWLSIGPDGTVTIMCPSAEMGQGVYSTLPAIVAEELKVAWEQVRVEIAPADAAYINPLIGLQGTFGSYSVRGHFDALRLVGATARELLRQAAANRWQAPLTECSAADGAVVHAPSGRRLDYGDLVAEAAELPPPESPALTPRQEWRLLGTRLPRKDTPPKLDGSAVFGIDVRLPGLLTGAVAACPVAGGTLKQLDPAPALALGGVRKVVPLAAAVIVIADDYWAAHRGLQALEPVWDFGPNQALDDASIGQALNQALEQTGVAVEADEGAENLFAATGGGVIEARYEVPYLAHATMEPMNATAHFRQGGVEIWAPTQSPGIARFVVAGALGIDPASATVHSTFLGGGFGRRSETDFVLYAVEASKAVGVPVKVIWSREEDMRHDFYRTRAAARLAARLDGGGAITAWHGRYACQSIMARLQPAAVEGGADDTSLEGAVHMPYRLGARRSESVRVAGGLPVGFWRSPGYNQNTFFVESFIDELAHAAGVDGLAFRLRLLQDQPRHRAVLERAARMIGWRRPAEPGVHRGIALAEAHGSIVAEGVEIGWEAERRIRIRRISCAIDCGLALNPDTIEAQMESGIVYGLTAALWGEINVSAGRVVQGNFNDYQALRLPQMPPVDVAIIEGGDAPGGVGEPGTPPIAPALTNAIFAASGERIRTLPLARHGIALA